MVRFQNEKNLKDPFGVFLLKVIIMLIRLTSNSLERITPILKFTQESTLMETHMRI